MQTDNNWQYIRVRSAYTYVMCKIKATYLLTYLLTSRCFTYDDDERLEESQNLLRDGVPKTCEYESTKAGHLDVEYGEDGAEDAADHADQQRRTEHYKVHGDRAPQLQIQTHTHTRARAHTHK